MDYFSLEQKIALARSLVTKTSPAYVQFYITARCNLACEQCNIIYADANAQEMNIDQIRQMADNLAMIGVCMVLLIGGEPFVRKDLPEIVKTFTERGIHVRMQTNGLATREALAPNFLAAAIFSGDCIGAISPPTKMTVSNVRLPIGLVSTGRPALPGTGPPACEMT